MQDASARGVGKGSRGRTAREPRQFFYALAQFGGGVQVRADQVIDVRFERGYALPPEVVALLPQERLRACGAHQFVGKLVTHSFLKSSIRLS